MRAEHSSGCCCSDDEEEEERPLLRKEETPQGQFEILSRYHSLNRLDSDEPNGQTQYRPSSMYYNHKKWEGGKSNPRLDDRNLLLRQSIRDCLEHGLEMNIRIQSSVYVHNWARHRFHSESRTEAKLFSWIALTCQIFIPLTVIFDAWPGEKGFCKGITYWPSISAYDATSDYSYYHTWYNYLKYVFIHVTIGVVVITAFISYTGSLTDKSRFFRFLYESDPITLLIRGENGEFDILQNEGTGRTVKGNFGTRQKVARRRSTILTSVPQGATKNAERKINGACEICGRQMTSSMKTCNTCGADRGRSVRSASENSRKLKGVSGDAAHTYVRRDIGIGESSDSDFDDEDKASAILLDLHLRGTVDRAESVVNMNRSRVQEKQLMRKRRQIKKHIVEKHKADRFLQLACSIQQLSLRLVLIALSVLFLTTANEYGGSNQSAISELVLNCISLGFVLSVDEMFIGVMSQGQTLHREIFHVFNQINFYSDTVDEWIDKVIAEERNGLRLGAILIPEFRILPFLTLRYPFIDYEFFKKDFLEMLLALTDPFYILFLIWFIGFFWICI